MRADISISVILLAACLGTIPISSIGIIRVANADESVHFDGAVYPPTPYQIRRALQKGSKPEPVPGLRLEGRLRKPDGEGPFPAVVVMHGCGGIWRWNDVWSDRLTNWGYVVLDVDSFGPREKTSICHRPESISGETRALDAHGAKAFLAGLPFVDSARIAVMGMSHGGWTALHAIRRGTTSDLELEPFRAAIALYPWCDAPSELDAPLLILIGELDEWTPAARCKTFVAGVSSSSEVILEVYPDAHHLFDLKDIDTRQEGYVLRYHPQAADDAVPRIREFLAKHL